MVLIRWKRWWKLRKHLITVARHWAEVRIRDLPREDKEINTFDCDVGWKVKKQSLIRCKTVNSCNSVKASRDGPHKRNPSDILELPSTTYNEGATGTQRVCLQRRKHFILVARALVVRWNRETEHPVRTALHRRKIQAGCQGVRLAERLRYVPSWRQNSSWREGHLPQWRSESED